MEPWISIVVPVFNVEDYLKKCIDSLLAQSFRNWEIILVDDGSTDASGRLCDEFAREYPNVRVIHKTNGGLASARNQGLCHARGEYVAFVDSDDYVDPDTYEVLHRKCRDSKPDILNYGYRKVCNGRVLLEEYAVFPEGEYDYRQIQNRILPDSIAREKAFDQVNLPVQLSACMCIYRREFLKKHGIVFESERLVLCEDWLFNIRCLCRAEAMVILHNCFYNYVTRKTSLSQSYKPDSYERRQRLFLRYREELEKIGRQDDPVIRQRLRNFWLEAVYGCYIVELLAPRWNAEVKNRMERLCRDADFRAGIRELNRDNCTLKGHIFRIVTKFRLHGVMRLVYGLKRKRDQLAEKEAIHENHFHNPKPNTDVATAVAADCDALWPGSAQ